VINQDSIRRVVKLALGKEEGEAAPRKEIKHKADNSLYVISFLTNSFEINGTRVTMDYGPNMVRNKYTRDQMEEVGFTNHGDNFRWKGLFWKFTMDNKPVYYKAELSESGKKAVESIEFGSDEVHVDNNTRTLQVADLHSLHEYPFSNEGFLKMGKSGETFLPGTVSFLDVSDGKGKEIPGKMSLDKFKSDQGLNSLKSEAHPKDFIEDDGTGNNYRYWKNNSLYKISGESDANATKVVNDILSHPLQETQPGEPGQEENVEQGKSVFQPQGETHKKEQLMNGEEPGGSMSREERFKRASEGVDAAVSKQDLKNQGELNNLKKEELDIDKEKNKMNNQYGVAASAINLVKKFLDQ